MNSTTNNYRSEMYIVPRNILIDVLDALDDNCNFFACEGSFFPPIHMNTCRNCNSAWEIKMMMCGYSLEEMSQIKDLYEREYWRIWRRMDDCPHDNISDEEMDDTPCPDCGKRWFGREDDAITVSRIIFKEQKIINSAINMIIDLQEEGGIDCSETKKILYS